MMRGLDAYLYGMYDRRKGARGMTATCKYGFHCMYFEIESAGVGRRV